MRETNESMHRLPHPRVLAILGVVNALLVALLGYDGWSLARAGSLDDFGAAPAFALTDQLERPVIADEFRGRVVVANFVYTSCRESCPLLSLRMAALQERLRQEGLLGDRVQLLSFTVDPRHDTPAVLRAYAERAGADPQAWHFLTGPEDEIVPVIVRGFFQGVTLLPTSSAIGSEAGGMPGNSSEVMHSNRFVLIDRQGHMRAFYEGLELDPDQVMHDIRRLLR